MFYGLIQQLLPQHPLCYPLTLSPSPDHNCHLISYPYLPKYPTKGDNTAFPHLDINLQKYIPTAQPVNKSTTSLSLDHEFHNSYTIILPPFHHHIPESHKRREQRPQHTGPTTTNCSNQYLSDHRKQSRELVPVPCPAYGLLFIHRPHIPTDVDR